MIEIFHNILTEAHEAAVSLMSESCTFDVTETDKEILKCKKRELESLISEMKIVLETLEKNDEQWIALCESMTGAERNGSKKENQEFLNNVPYKVTIMRLKIRLSKMTSLLKKFLDEDVSFKNNKASVPLPKLKLPTFSGVYTDFFSFWDRFKFTVHDNDSLPGVIKLTYLMECLKDRALGSVERLSIVNENYEVAVRILKEKFGKREFVVGSLYEELSELSWHNSFQGRKFVDGLEKILRQLENLGEPIDNTFIYITIQKKLPAHILKEIVTHENKLFTMEQKLSMLRQKLQETIYL